MISKALHIEQPYSGEYAERIYDISSPWNSGEWSWIKFEEENDVWCGEFRGSFIGAVCSAKIGIVIILTSDYMYTLDINTAELIKFDSQTGFTDITVTPTGDILVTNGYDVKIILNDEKRSIENIVLPIAPDNLKFKEYNGNILRITCEEFLGREEEKELYLDCNSFKLVNE